MCYLGSCREVDDIMHEMRVDLDVLPGDPFATEMEAPSATEEQDRSHMDEDEADDYVPIDVDDIVDIMLKAVRDKDTVVRWSGAKGIGRLTGECSAQCDGCM